MQSYQAINKSTGWQSYSTHPSLMWWFSTTAWGGAGTCWHWDGWSFIFKDNVFGWYVDSGVNCAYAVMGWIHSCQYMDMVFIVMTETTPPRVALLNYRCLMDSPTKAASIVCELSYSSSAHLFCHDDHRTSALLAHAQCTPVKATGPSEPGQIYSIIHLKQFQCLPHRDANGSSDSQTAFMPTVSVSAAQPCSPPPSAWHGESCINIYSAVFFKGPLQRLVNLPAALMSYLLAVSVCVCVSCF